MGICSGCTCRLMSGRQDFNFVRTVIEASPSRQLQKLRGMKVQLIEEKGVEADNYNSQLKLNNILRFVTYCILNLVEFSILIFELTSNGKVWSEVESIKSKRMDFPLFFFKLSKYVANALAVAQLYLIRPLIHGSQ